MMDKVMQFFLTVSYFAFDFTLALMLGQLVRCVRRPVLLVATCLAFAIFLLVGLSCEFQHTLVFLVAVAGFIVGRAYALSPKTMRRISVAVPMCVIVGTFCDLLLKSGITQWGIPSFSELVDWELAPSLLTITAFGTLLTVVAFLVLYLAGCGITALVTRHCSPVRRTFFCLLGSICASYLIETQLHFNVIHPYLMHHPFVTIATVAGLILGFIGAQNGVFSSVAPLHPCRPLASGVIYFAVYHAVMEIGEHTSSWVLSTPYDWLIMSVSAISIPFGVMLEGVWQGNRATTIERIDHVMRPKELLTSAVETMKTAWDKLTDLMIAVSIYMRQKGVMFWFLHLVWSGLPLAVLLWPISHARISVWIIGSLLLAIGGFVYHFHSSGVLGRMASEVFGDGRILVAEQKAIELLLVMTSSAEEAMREIRNSRLELLQRFVARAPKMRAAWLRLSVAPASLVFGGAAWWLWDVTDDQRIFIGILVSFLLFTSTYFCQSFLLLSGERLLKKWKKNDW